MEIAEGDRNSLIHVGLNESPTLHLDGIYTTIDGAGYHEIDYYDNSNLKRDVSRHTLPMNNSKLFKPAT